MEPGVEAGIASEAGEVQPGGGQGVLEFLRDVGKHFSVNVMLARETVKRSAPRQLTAFKDPAPQFAGVTAQLVTYKRKDGVELAATVYLPAGYDKAKDGALPFLLWAYPREFGSTDAASQVIGSPYRFTRPSGCFTATTASPSSIRYS